ncbi:MAG: DNA mismatch repair protein MutL [Anaerolineae bacterium]|nr:DNA mismatch repair protein MutL [Anaerolineae bacterium]
MIEVAHQEPPADGPAVAVAGFTGATSLHRGGRDQIIFFVNKRWIQDRALNQAVVQAYHTFLPVGRFPVTVLNIELDPGEVDVNVHPTKAEVKFQSPRLVFKAVQKAVREAVVAAAPVPGMGGHAFQPAAPVTGPGSTSLALKRSARCHCRATTMKPAVMCGNWSRPRPLKYRRCGWSGRFNKCTLWPKGRTACI